MVDVLFTVDITMKINRCSDGVLPDSNQDVLVITADKLFYIGWWDGNDNEWCVYGDDTDVVAWAELPDIEDIL